MTAPIVVDDGALAGVVCTAVEGGVSYWCRVSRYQWKEEAGRLRAASARLHPSERLVGFDGVLPVHELTPEVVRVGLDRIAAVEPGGAGALDWNSEDVERVRRACAEDPELPDLDAGLADAIVQVGLFGKVLFS